MPYASAFRPNLFEGQTIFIPGGGGGLGRCIAHELASLGAKLVLAGRSMEKLERTRDEIAADGGSVLGVYTAELRSEVDVRELTQRILDSHGRVHGLVNAAGGQFPARLEDLSLNGWNAVINNNLTSYFLTARELYLQCLREHGGNIVHVGANWEGGMPGMGHNGAARAGLSNLTMTSAVEWAPAGVRVNCVIPGFIATTGLDRYPEDAWAGIRGVARQAPLQRYGTAAEVSSAVVFLMSDAAAYVTGIDLRADGGMHFGASSFVFTPEPPRNGRVFRGFHREERAHMLGPDSDADN